MIVAVSIFEIHIPQAQSLKEKRMVVKSLRDRIRNKFEVSVAEIGAHDLHQRGRLGIAVVTTDQTMAEKILQSIEEFVASNLDGNIIGWANEFIDFDGDAPLTTSGVNWE